MLNLVREGSFYDDVVDYRNICTMLNITPKGAEINYDHFEELRDLPCVYWEDGKYHNGNNPGNITGFSANSVGVVTLTSKGE